MAKTVIEILQEKLDDINLKKLTDIHNDKLNAFVAEFVEKCNPASVFVCTDSQEDLLYIKDKAVENKEEIELAIAGHTMHFDGPKDQARDKDHTQFLVPKGVDLGPNINAIDKETGTAEVLDILDNMMEGREVIVRFFCLGPTDSEFSVLSCQMTDSYYVAHSLDLLYRQGYEAFKRAGAAANFFRVIHSQGELENSVSKNLDKRRIYIDTEDEIVYSTNTQYGGNTLGLKKLSMRLAIKRASQENWLCEHMFVMGVYGPNNRKTYFTGAFPSLCGKTSTSMMTGESIVGDDIAYLRSIDGVVRAVNVEKGMFGIIMGINSKDDPIIFKTLHSPNEIIFSNILMTEEGGTYWIDKDSPEPAKGINFQGEWTPDKTDANGKPVPPSHKNARFTLSLTCLENVDEALEDPAGVEVGGIIYGGRDSSAWVPVRQAFGWEHGIITIGAALESETTAATLGKEGVPVFNPMSNLDFVSVPLGKYIQSNLDFSKDLKTEPAIFGVNYFLRGKDGQWLNDKTDKAVWLKWMELRTHGDAEAIETPVGFIPVFEDLQTLFANVLGKTYTEVDYNNQFTLRVNEFVAKIERIKSIYTNKVPDAPAVIFETLDAEIARLKEAQSQYGDYIAPAQFQK